MNAEPFDTDHDAAIRTVLRETVSESRRTAPRRLVVAIVLALGALLALGGGGYAFAAAHPELFGAEPAAAPAPTVSAAAPAPSAVGSPLVPTETPVAPSPTRTTSPSPTAATPAVQVPVIDTPAAGQTIPSGTVTIAGTGTPGSHVYLAEYCTLAPPACTTPEELGQPWQAQIIVGADGRWSTTTIIRPPQTTGFRIAASAAVVGPDGDPVGTASAQSPDRSFTVSGPTG
ncbi:hypothetical protein [Curtobacterium luteum]|uniref:hypothetical protein n=1 Tax=Curtobacterium luteum TaxID=33881 RepID=UPI00381169EC